MKGKKELIKMIDFYGDLDAGDKWAVNLQIDNFAKVILTDFVDYLLKEGYCDTDVYAEPPTAIDEFLSKR